MEESQPVAPAPAKRPKHNTWGLGQVSALAAVLQFVGLCAGVGPARLTVGLEGQDCAQPDAPLCMLDAAGGD